MDWIKLIVLNNKFNNDKSAFKNGNLCMLFEKITYTKKIVDE